MKSTRFLSVVVIASLVLGVCTNLSAQGGGGGNTGGGGFPGGGNTGGGNTGGGFTGGGTNFGTTPTTNNAFNSGTPTQNTGGNNNGGNTGGNSGGGTNNSQPLNLNNELNITPATPTAVDERNQGFIGPNAQQIINQGFVGAATQLSGGQPVSGASFGGGVNTQGGGGGAGGMGGGGIGGAQGLRATGGAMGRNSALGGMGGFGANANAGVRRNVRNRLVNQVQVNRVPPTEVAQRFSNRLDRIPNVAGIGSNVQVDVQSGTAVLTGRVPTAEAASKVERQLRLEPGIYRVENRLEIGQ